MKKLILTLLIGFPTICKANLCGWQQSEALQYLSWGDYKQALFSPNVVTIYYVSNTGSNSNNGTSTSTPWQTNSKVNSSQASFNAGDFILYKSANVFTGTLSITKSGSSGNPITYGSYDVGVYPAFTGTGSLIGDLVEVNNHDYITFQNWQIYDPLIDTTNRVHDVLSNIQIVFSFVGSSDHCIIQYCKMWAVGACMFSDGTGGFNTSQYNYMADLTMIKDTPGGDDDYGCNNFVWTTQGNQFLHNTCIRGYGHSYDYTLDGGNDIVPGAGSLDNNIVMYNYFDSCIGVVEMKGDMSGIVVAYNTMTNCGQSLTFQTGTQNVAAYNNNFAETSTEMPGQADKVFAGYNGSDVLISKNNNFWLVNGVDGYSSSSGLTHDYNIVHTAGGSSYGVTLNTHESTTSSNIWQSQSGPSNTWNYHLSATSAGLAAGVVIGGLSQIDPSGNPIGNPPNTGCFGSIVFVPAQIVLPATINGKTYTKFQ